ncbi:anthrone oxygenase family protein [Actinacidiphila soli]|jgi:uncharacterized membrane protein|uniref:anthrone oxygenase family protein n=1 Tax=Actinacidiphila soli TaxID=2487275 RepID=UPI000FCCB396|nr:DUF1772 domain-containing protein [Actinacidiphila soli]
MFMLICFACILRTLAHVHEDRMALIIAAVVLYVAMLAITFAVNVPLNDQLEAAGTPDRIPDLAAVREHFETTWVRWNIVRTLTCTVALACLSWALVLSGRRA